MQENEDFGIDVSYFDNVTTTWFIPDVEVMYYYFYNNE